ncbi:MAG: DUF362 domain-containing protein [Pirellulales bacterium]
MTSHEEQHSCDNNQPATTPCGRPLQESNGGLDRRALLVGGGAAALGLTAWAGVRHWLHRPEPVFVAKNQSYDGDLRRTIRDGLLATGVTPSNVGGRRVLLKPNMVEPDRHSPHITTNPAVLLAAAEVFIEWGAEVTVGEAPGHVRDTDMALVESGIADALRDGRLPFADLNYDDVGWRENAGHVSRLAGFFFPQSVLQADLVVSMPKLKTHHWVGMTASMKNLYGTLPGIKYGWPKNVLHYAGIPKTVVDIAASLPKTIAIIDAIQCMEGDGPIMGTPKDLGAIVIGRNTVAVDATCARMMRIEPIDLPYLSLAEGRLGSVSAQSIDQRGDDWHDLATRFELIDAPHLRSIRRT